MPRIKKRVPKGTPDLVIDSSNGQMVRNQRVLPEAMRMGAAAPAEYYMTVPQFGAAAALRDGFREELRPIGLDANYAQETVASINAGSICRGVIGCFVFGACILLVLLLLAVIGAV